MDYRHKYHVQKNMAIERGIEWEFTFETWHKLWTDSGHLAERGRGVGQYCMSRFNDVGPYSPTNVFIQLHGSNTTDAHKGVSKGPQSALHFKHNKEAQLKVNGRPIIVDGVEYPGVREAHRVTGIAVDTFYRRIAKGVAGYSWQ